MGPHIVCSLASDFLHLVKCFEVHLHGWWQVSAVRPFTADRSFSACRNRILSVCHQLVGMKATGGTLTFKSLCGCFHTHLEPLGQMATLRFILRNCCVWQLYQFTSHLQCRLPSLYILPEPVSGCVFDKRHPSGCKMVFQYGFNLYLPGD